MTTAKQDTVKFHSHDDITALQGKGYVTLQIPQFSIDIGPTPEPEVEPPEPQVELPADWFNVIKYVGNACRPCIGKENGFLFLTRKGYEANKERIRKAFEQAIAKGLDRTNGEGWLAFEKYAEKHFSEMEKTIEKEKNKFAKKVAELNTLKV